MPQFRETLAFQTRLRTALTPWTGSLPQASTTSRLWEWALPSICGSPLRCQRKDPLQCWARARREAPWLPMITTTPRTNESNRRRPQQSASFALLRPPEASPTRRATAPAKSESMAATTIGVGRYVLPISFRLPAQSVQRAALCCSFPMISLLGQEQLARFQEPQERWQRQGQGGKGRQGKGQRPWRQGARVTVAPPPHDGPSGELHRHRPMAFMMLLASMTLAAYPPPTIPDSLLVGGRLSLFEEQWTASSPFLGSIAREGVWVQWADGEPGRYDAGESTFCPSESILVQDEVAELLRKAAVAKIPEEKAHFVTSIFLVDKKGGSYRPVLNLKLSTSTRPRNTSSSKECR